MLARSGCLGFARRSQWSSTCRDVSLFNPLAISRVKTAEGPDSDCVDDGEVDPHRVERVATDGVRAVVCLRHRQDGYWQLSHQKKRWGMSIGPRGVAELCTMVGASATHHRWVHGLRARSAWRRVGHAAIFAAIAGSSTPIVMAALPGATGLMLAVAIRSAALLGARFKLSRWDGGDRVGDYQKDPLWRRHRRMIPTMPWQSTTRWTRTTTAASTTGVRVWQLEGRFATALDALIAGCGERSIRESGSSRAALHDRRFG